MVGRVLSMDRDAVELVVAPSGGYESTDDIKKPREIRVRYPVESMPPRLKVGDVIRIWGDFSTADNLQFKATHVGYGAGGRDPTGVRSRIHRGYGAGGGRDGGTRGAGRGHRGGP
ncbi:MAG: hypothetical protein HY788_15270 [Deltaproteobacteria bacterium]|nr:hypothetical protein [Deltaproteobacteria bacterium]